VFVIGTSFSTRGGAGCLECFPEFFVLTQTCVFFLHSKSQRITPCISEFRNARQLVVHWLNYSPISPEVFTEMTVWTAVFWVVTPCSLVDGYRCFGGTRFVSSGLNIISQPRTSQSSLQWSCWYSQEPLRANRKDNVKMFYCFMCAWKRTWTFEVRRRHLTARSICISLELILKIFLCVYFLNDFTANRSRNLKISYDLHKMDPDTTTPLRASFTFQSSSRGKIRNRLKTTRLLMFHA
jgi:hypothetical protein